MNRSTVGKSELCQCVNIPSQAVRLAIPRRRRNEPPSEFGNIIAAAFSNDADASSPSLCSRILASDFLTKCPG